MEDSMNCLRALREVKILNYLRQDNVVRMLDLLVPHDFSDFHEIYIAQVLISKSLVGLSSSSPLLTFARCFRNSWTRICTRSYSRGLS